MLVRDKETGQVGRWVPGVGFTPVSAAEAQVMQQSDAENVARSTGGALFDNTVSALEMANSVLPGSNVLGALEGVSGLLGGPTPLRDAAEQARAINDPNQQARASARPNQELIGQGAAIGIEAAVTGPKALTSLGLMGRAGQQATRRSAGALSKVDDVIQQNRRAGQAAQRADDTALAGQRARDAQVPPPQAAQRADGSINAASNPSMRTADLADVVTPAQADAIGMPLSGAQRKYLAAWQSGDMSAVRKAEDALANDDYIRAMGFGDTNVGSFADTLRGKGDLKDWMTGEIMSELGEHSGGRLTDNMMNSIRTREQQVFKEAFDAGNYPVELRFSNAQGDMVDVVHKAQEQLDALGNPSNALKRAVDDIKAAAQQGDDGVFDSEKLLNTRSRIMKDTETAFKNGESQNGGALSSIQEVLDDAIEAALPPETLSRVQLARRRWKIIKTIQRTAGTKSRLNLGEINPAQFTANYRAMTPSYRVNSRATNDFEKIMTTVDTLTRDRAHAGNTLIRGVAPTALKYGGAAVTGAGIGAGMGLLD